MTATEFPVQKLSFLLEIYDQLSFQVKNSLFYIKFMTETEFPVQKLSFLLEIYDQLSFQVKNSLF